MQTIYDAKILIVDDNQDLLNLVTTALRSTGYNQLTACTGCAAAQAAFAANRPDLMILDINLPDGDGFTLFRTLHSMAEIPALFLSARDADADRLFGLGLGADDYLTKRFNAEAFAAHPAHFAALLSGRTAADCRKNTPAGPAHGVSGRCFGPPAGWHRPPLTATDALCCKSWPKTAAISLLMTRCAKPCGGQTITGTRTA